ncbi:MAG: hypothetical protein ABJD24_13235 [Acidimicrobiales bacterium]
MTAEELAGYVRRLYSLDPSDFTAERNAVVKELKKAKRAEDAAFVAALRKPSAVEHAVNTVAREKKDVVERWAKAVAAAVEAQSATIGGGSGAAFREATAELRTATGALVNAAVAALGGEAGTKRAQVATAVQGLSAGNGPELVVDGLVGSAAQEADSDLFAGAPDPPPRTKSAATKPAKGPSPSDIARRQRAEDKRKTALGEVEHAESAVRAAEKVLAAAKARLQKVEDELRALDS